MIRLGLMISALLISGCENSEPYDRIDTWHPTGANAGNIAAMAARPGDMILGRDGIRTDARQAGGAVDLVWQGHARALPAGNSTTPQAAAPIPAQGGPS